MRPHLFRNFVRSSLIVAGIASAAAGSARAEVIALATDLRGRVTVQRAGQSDGVPLTATTFLQAGDRVMVGDDGGATLFQLHAPVRVLSPGARVTLAALPRSTRPDCLPEDLFLLMRRQFPASGPSPATRPSTEQEAPGNGRLTAIAPRQTVLLERRPILTWTPVPGATSYQVTLYDAKENPVWQTSATKTQVGYPADRKPLAPGRYLWDVVARPGALRQLAGASFVVIAPAQNRRIRHDLKRAMRLLPDRQITPLPCLAVYLEHGVYGWAETVLQQATTRSPGDTVLARLLSRAARRTEHRGAARERLRPLTYDAK